MRISFHRSFEKKYVKLTVQLKVKVKERNTLFEGSPFDPLLNNHALKGKFKGHRSINVTGDWRIVYRVVADDVALFVDIDTHSNLYK